MALENRADILAALDDAEVKAGGTLLERAQARQALRDIRQALRDDPQGFKMHLDAIEHAYRSGVKDRDEGRAPASGPGLAQAFADYEVRRLAEIAAGR